MFYSCFFRGGAGPARGLSCSACIQAHPAFVPREEDVKKNLHSQLDIYIHIFEISKLRHGKWPFFKSKKMSPEIFFYTAETGKDKFERYQITRPKSVDYHTLNKNIYIYIYTAFHFKNAPLLAFLRCRGPLGECPAKIHDFFKCSLIQDMAT